MRLVVRILLFLVLMAVLPSGLNFKNLLNLLPFSSFGADSRACSSSTNSFNLNEGACVLESQTFPGFGVADAAEVEENSDSEKDDWIVVETWEPEGSEDEIRQAMHKGAVEGARGFNEDIAWVNSMEEAKKQAAASGKPILALVHNPACHACEKLKVIFSHGEDSDRIAELSQDFVMLNLLDTEEPSDNSLKPDGEYIPRLVFLDSNGSVDVSLVNNKGSQGFNYFYYRSEDVIREMNFALKTLSRGKKATSSDPTSKEKSLPNHEEL